MAFEILSAVIKAVLFKMRVPEAVVLMEEQPEALHLNKVAALRLPSVEALPL